jgi:hypothetical protein
MANTEDNQKSNRARDQIIRMVIDGEKLGYDGGKPRVPSKENSEKQWVPPKKGTTPSNRKK